MSFFNKEFLQFLLELKENNNREWFLDNKKNYEENVKKPFEQFVQHMIYTLHEDDDNLMVTPKECIFRIYRDIRFSKDKTPYKTHVSAVIANGGRKNNTDPGVYLEITGEYFRFYSGIYQLSKEQLGQVRNYIGNNLEEFNSLLNDKKFKKHFGKIRGEYNKRLPKEFTEVFKQQPLIANKQFYYFSELESSIILSKNLTSNLMKLYNIAKPMNVFLKGALGG